MWRMIDIRAFEPRVWCVPWDRGALLMHKEAWTLRLQVSACAGAMLRRCMMCCGQGVLCGQTDKVTAAGHLAGPSCCRVALEQRSSSCKAFFSSVQVGLHDASRSRTCCLPSDTWQGCSRSSACVRMTGSRAPFRSNAVRSDDIVACLCLIVQACIMLATKHIVFHSYIPCKHEPEALLDALAVPESHARLFAKSKDALVVQGASPRAVRSSCIALY